MTAPKIEYLNYDPRVQNYKYLWLKYIESVDLSQHCQNTFVGLSSRKFGTRFIANARAPLEFNDIRLNEIIEPKAYYLCGVSDPYYWDHNFHLAFIPQKGNRLIKSGRGLELSILDAVEVKITPNFIDFRHPAAKDRDYATCRNWQFAWQVQAGLEYPDARRPKPVQDSMI